MNALGVSDRGVVSAIVPELEITWSATSVAHASIFALSARLRAAPIATRHGPGR